MVIPEARSPQPEWIINWTGYVELCVAGRPRHGRHLRRLLPYADRQIISGARARPSVTGLGHARDPSGKRETADTYKAMGSAPYEARPMWCFEHALLSMTYHTVLSTLGVSDAEADLLK
jgi:hypothetical protein